ncbi:MULTISPECIES: ABC transporter substrate-binding protein [unclassified Leucobacter]|uniref:ABC transporter substrate-binding protein n=1 Tax=unclassified Leucobacter TaxID=2621730 RepID=UPI00165DE5AC|nr:MULTISPECIES: ABC transporter substrate-binding protein [unclassified Leucobacter]MBC9927017.1 ABC transporter substrate-binding protein [Leucobacter sp. cx-169]
MRTTFGPKVATTIAIAASITLVMTGCAGGSNAAGGEGGGNDRIELVMMQPPTAALNPFSDDVAKLSRWSTGETLVRLNENLEIEPLLATEWEQVDELTWIFTLRDDVTFHDGTPFDAAAAKNTFDQAASSTTPPRALKGISVTTEATGDYELTVTTDVPDPLLTNRFASPQLSVFSDAAYLEDGTVTPVGTGTGPFELVDVQGTTTATLDRYEDYWGDVALASGIDVSFVPDGAARAGALRAGTADVAETIPVSQVTLLDPEMVNEVFMPRSTIMTMNNTTGPFADPAVRAAARAAIDPQAIVETVYEGQADPSTGLLGPAIPWAEPMRGDVESGVAPAKVDGIAITLATYTDRAENPEIAVQLEKQLEDAGFVVTQDVREYVNMEEEMLNPGFDAVIYSRGTMLDTGDPLSFLAQDFTCDGGYNVAQLCNADVDALIKASLQIPAGEERQQATMDAEAAILQLDAVVPLVHERVVQGEAGTFTDLVRDPLERRLITEYTTRVK